jgi:hypothetical protein
MNFWDKLYKELRVAKAAIGILIMFAPFILHNCNHSNQLEKRIIQLEKTKVKK